MSQVLLNRLEQLIEWLKSEKAKRVFFVADEEAFIQSGARKRLAELPPAYDCEFFSDFEPNPQLGHVRLGLRALGNDSTTAVVAIGGGTAIDIAKLLCFFSAQSAAADADNLERVTANDFEVQARLHSLAAIPTTSGTGSETTQFAVVYDKGKKHSIAHASLLPDVAVCDATLTHSLPPAITAATGLDALCQAIESLWSVRSTRESTRYAQEALRLCLENLESAVLSPNPTNRAGMMQAAYLAGQAINISRTTAAHALSYSMTIHHGVPHGFAVAMSLGPLLRWNGCAGAADLIDPRGINHIQHVMNQIYVSFGCDPLAVGRYDQVVQKWEDLLHRIGAPVRLADVGIATTAERAEIAQSVNAERLANNPRRLDSAELLQLVEEMA